MKSKIYLVVFCFGLFSFFQCKTSQSPFVKNPPFKIKGAIFNNWIGGQPGAEGTNVKITLYKTDIKLKEVYFNNRKEKLYLRKNKDSIPIYTANFPKYKDFKLHGDSNKEYGNAVEMKKEDFPFNLKENECVISFEKFQDIYYHKIKLVKKPTESYQ